MTTLSPPAPLTVLVTGGAGYIGSTVCSALEDRGHTPVVLDSLVQGREEFTRGRPFYRGDIADTALVERILEAHPQIGAVIHLAALIVVPESVEQPGRYYRANVAGALALFDTLIGRGVRRLLFSSSAAVYDASATMTVSEDSPLRPLSPYARTKAMTEQILEDVCRAGGARGIALRYFNPVGADPQLRSGPYLRQPSHVLGRIMEAAAGRSPVFNITGTDFDTRDGTGLRDYIHVWDLAQAHVQAVESFDVIFARAATAGMDDTFLPINLGTGQGVTVRELVQAFGRASGVPLTAGKAPRRPGDSAGACAVIDRARTLMDWAPQLSTEQAIRDALAWERHRATVLAGVEPSRAPLA
ncbi:UDP-glucose 4-epimerase GalE [Deinococcus sp. KSM4-11]|uniref:UDP-glucose 4-epimerase GalE n=1 Tax=Deinococcus sp. KSM4-11 TaxID=2568654 RepID=UPI0010A403A7|nr:UDP-glucose 4-epimerase GalE [Deinococcus sp. KSM4-11]THF87358.1 UDP-glucose 4-epimerase GalE [Deinococcus sp. KSM4-11]